MENTIKGMFIMSLRKIKYALMSDNQLLNLSIKNNEKILQETNPKKVSKLLDKELEVLAQLSNRKVGVKAYSNHIATLRKAIFMHH